jgi:hypothetical protein
LSGPPGIRDVIRDQLFRLLAVLVGFLVASAVVVVADAPVWTKLLAALLALASVFIVALWLPLPWSDWRARRGRRLWVAAAPLALAGLVLVLGLTIWRGGPDPVPRNPATLIVLDTSDGMGELLDSKNTKLSQATKSLTEQARDLGNDQLGLATFGVDDCESGETPLDERVPIAPDNADRIKAEASADLVPAGKANLVSAARYALGRLNEFTGRRRRVLIITGGLDACGGDLGELISEREIKGVAVQWELVGLGLSPEEKAQASGLPGVTVHVADTSRELREVLNLTLFEEPIRAEFEELREYVESEVRDPLNEAVDAVNADPPDPRAARSHLDEVERLTGLGQDRFAEFGIDDEAAVFRPVKDILHEQFGLLAEGASALEQVAAFDDEHPGELDEVEHGEREELIDAANAPIETYNENLDELGDRIERALNELFGA